MLRRIHTFNARERIRNKLIRWNLPGVPAKHSRAVEDSLRLIAARCKPKVASAYLRTIWNGWPTSHRMRTMANAPAVRPCLFGCQHAEDRIEHYAVCNALWNFFATPKPAGLGLNPSMRSLSHFLLASHDMGDHEKIDMAIANYVAFRSTQLYRTTQSSGTTIFKLYAKEAVAPMNSTT